MSGLWIIIIRQRQPHWRSRNLYNTVIEKKRGVYFGAELAWNLILYTWPWDRLWIPDNMLSVLYELHWMLTVMCLKVAQHCRCLDAGNHNRTKVSWTKGSDIDLVQPCSNRTIGPRPEYVVVLVQQVCKWCADVIYTNGNTITLPSSAFLPSFLCWHQLERCHRLVCVVHIQN